LVLARSLVSSNLVNHFNTRKQNSNSALFQISILLLAHFLVCLLFSKSPTFDPFVVPCIGLWITSSKQYRLQRSQTVTTERKG